MKSIHFSNVSFSFEKGPKILQGANFSLSSMDGEGKIVALMGNSGSGKSTILKLISKSLSPQSGTIVEKPEKAKIGHVAQTATIFDDLSIEENLKCLKYSKILGRSFEDSRIRIVLETGNIEQLFTSKRSPRTLSIGERQRLAILRFFLVDFDILLLDEPCSSLDATIKMSVIKLLRQLVDTKASLAVLVTHTWKEVFAAADEVLYAQRTEQGIKLHHSTIDSFQKAPPTLDAFISIFWPHCLIVEQQELPKSFMKSQSPETYYWGFCLDKEERLFLRTGLARKELIKKLIHNSPKLLTFNSVKELIQ